MSRFINTHAFTIQKTASYYLTHISVASLVAYAVTGDVMAAIALSLLEPSVQAVVYFFHERAWQRVAQRRAHEAASADGTPCIV
jgi:uncharacterized membrane protein